MTCRVPTLLVKGSIKNNYEWDIDIICPMFSLMTSQHMEDNLVEGFNLYIRLALPLTFSFVSSFNRLSTEYKVEKLMMKVVPKDF